MSVFDFLRKFFVGPSESATPHADSQFRNDFRNPIWETNESDDSDNDFRSPLDGNFSFNIYTNPIEIHRFFEQQMNEMLRNFSMMDPFREFQSFFDSGFSGPALDQQPFDSFHNQLPAVEEPRDSSKSLREQLLKPEFRGIESSSEKVDRNLDGKVGTDDILQALDKKDSTVPIWTPNNSEKSLVPRGDTFMFSSGRSVITRIVRRPDGTTEREEIVRNSDGTERKTVTRSAGDMEYSVSTFKDATGVEQRTENFKNLEPEKIDEFKRAWDTHNSKWWSWWSNDKKSDF